MYQFIHHLTSETCWYFLPFFFVVLNRRFFLSWWNRSNLLILNELPEAWKLTPSGLKGKNWVNLNILIETLNLNLISFGPIHKAGKLPTIIACSSPPRICRHLEEFRQVFKNSVHTFIDIERKHLTRVLKFISRPSPFLSSGRGKGWLARCHPLLWYRSFSISTRKRVSSYCVTIAGDIIWEMVGNGCILGRLPFSVLPVMSPLVTCASRKNIVLSNRPWARCCKKCSERTCTTGNFTLKLQKTPEVWHAITQFAMVGKEMHPFHGHKISL